MKSVMNHTFSRIPSADIPRSVFDRSHGYKTTFNEDVLVPFYVDEALPGDTFKCHATLFARMATPIVPIMDNLWLDSFYFAVPNRILWQHWEEFNGASDSAGIQPVDYLVPKLNTAGFINTVGTIYDYMGLPLGNLSNATISALPFRAYNKIWNDWFRDQNLIDALDVPLNDGPDGIGLYSLRYRGKRHDYFTSALPWPQKGPGVSLPLGVSAPVHGTGLALGLIDPFASYGLQSIGGSPAISHGADSFGASVGTPGVGTVAGTTYAMGVTENTDGSSGLAADLTSATSATINSLRQAFQLQRMYERDARGGTRYTEILRAHFQVVSPDFRLQRSEYLGGSSQRISINPVQQTSGTDISGESTPQGNLAAFGQVADSKGGFTKSFVEHMTLIGLINVRADLTYQQGLPRMFSRQTRFDFYWPALAHLGEQEIRNKEIFFANDVILDNEIFGYQERFAEYRYFPSQITGLYRTNAPLSLDIWHLSQNFTGLPGLNESFIQSNTPIGRVVAVPSQPHFLFDSYMELHCARPMPVYAVPGLIDHF